MWGGILFLGAAVVIFWALGGSPEDIEESFSSLPPRDYESTSLPPWQSRAAV